METHRKYIDVDNRAKCDFCGKVLRRDNKINACKKHAHKSLITKQKQKEYYDNNKDDENFKNKIKLLQEKNKGKKKEYDKLRSKRKKIERRKYFADYKRERSKRDVLYRLKNNLRKRTWEAFKRNKINKKNKTLKLLGASIDKVKLFVESKFIDDMSWENYGKWHIDHIVPCASFNLALIEEQKKCFHYTNLQPLWAIDNIRKGSKILLDKETDTIPDVNGHDSPIAITKITLAHHKEDKDYYIKLKKAMPNG